MNSSSGYWCEMVKSIRWCVPYNDYKKEGFRLAKAKTYEEIFGVKL